MRARSRRCSTARGRSTTGGPFTAHVEPDRTLSDTLTDDPTPLRFRSAAATDVGRARSNNEDGFVERPEVGLWAVADGLGGHSDGEIASRMVCDALADFEPDRSFEDTVEAARERMQQVNDHLLRAAGTLASWRIAAAAPSWCCWCAACAPRSSGRATVACIDGGPAGWNS